MYPEAIEHVIKEEENAKCYNSEFSEKPHCSFDLLEPGLLVSSSYFWIGASLNGIRKFHCCDPSVEEIKCPFKGRDLDLKIAFLLPTVGGKEDENGNFFFDKNHLHYFQVQIGMAISGFKTCHFVTNTSKGIFIVTINFNDKFWETVVATVYKFYCQQIVPSFLMEALPHDNFHTKTLSPSQEDQQIQ